MTITSRLAAAARTHGGRTALRTGTSHLTYEDVHRTSERLAAALAARGIGRGQAFAAQADNCPELMLLYYAAARLGAVFVPVNQELSAREVTYILDHVEARLLFHDEAHANVAREAARPGQRCPIADLFAGLGEETLPDSYRPGDLADDFLVIYTSGSTGVPKAVVFDQANEIGGNRSLAEMWAIGPEDVTLVALPLGFLYGLSTAAATGIQAGGEVVVLRRFHPRDVLEALVKRRASIYHGVPTMFAMMLDYAEAQGLNIDLSPVRLLISAGAPLSEELRSRFEARFGKRIDDYYALTEVRPIFGKPWDDPRPIPRGSLGKLAPGAQALILDTEGHPVPPGEHGELLVRAPGMLVRYHRDEPLTNAALADGWFRTGDLGRRDADGNHFLTGRIKDIIIRGGANIAPVEIEEVLNAHPSVRAAAVLGVPHQTFGEVPVAYVVPRAGNADAAELKAFCAGRLAGFKVPADIVALDAFPLGPTGKVDRKALKQMWLDSQ